MIDLALAIALIGIVWWVRGIAAKVTVIWAVLASEVKKGSET